MDSRGQMDDTDPLNGRNLGLKNRCIYSKGWKEVEMEGSLFVTKSLMN